MMLILIESKYHYQKILINYNLLKAKVSIDNVFAYAQAAPGFD
jgi:hypothetical protein